MNQRTEARLRKLEMAAPKLIQTQEEGSRLRLREWLQALPTDAVIEFEALQGRRCTEGDTVEIMGLLADFIERMNNERGA